MNMMTGRPDCKACGHNYFDHNDYWDTVDTDGITPIKDQCEGTCRKCECQNFTAPDSWEERNPVIKYLYHTR